MKHLCCSLTDRNDGDHIFNLNSYSASKKVYYFLKSSYSISNMLDCLLKSLNCFLISVDSASKKAYCLLKMLDCFLISVDRVLISVESASKKAYCFLISVDRIFILVFSQAFRFMAFSNPCLLFYLSNLRIHSCV